MNSCKNIIVGIDTAPKAYEVFKKAMNIDKTKGSVKVVYCILFN